MAMKMCRECGHAVSSGAKICPNCGVKKPYESPVRGFIFIAIVVFAVIKGCSSSSDKSSAPQAAAAPTSTTFAATSVAKAKAAAPANMAAASTKPFSDMQVCRSAIAGMFGRDLNSVKAEKTNTAGVFTLSYRRQSDGQRFSYDCKLSDANVIWKETGQSSNRWNGSGTVEFNVVFSVNGSALTITELHAGSDVVTYKYTMKDFR
ncbi:zinc ribbon domain-containing protein [Candidatus Symbiopectobacterium sp. NZEC135]|uniref:zinc ribbon domain-containing protein n=1 Tax=Candidatus Symbiopectobacterium sp. NZEC135 TaxID=2820471 RepID=UPI002227CF01|nr:zinc ribbon domain-containing protein [Candidatus Symbiopectobacterium sp. NZEC135]